LIFPNGSIGKDNDGKGARVYRIQRIAAANTGAKMNRILVKAYKAGATESIDITKQVIDEIKSRGRFSDIKDEMDVYVVAHGVYENVRDANQYEECEMIDEEGAYAFVLSQVTVTEDEELPEASSQSFGVCDMSDEDFAEVSKADEEFYSSQDDGMTKIEPAKLATRQFSSVHDAGDFLEARRAMGLEAHIDMSPISTTYTHYGFTVVHYEQTAEEVAQEQSLREFFSNLKSV
jgi:hypothetical protein